ncbi:MAG: superoxide dismutase family protein [bacterium]
MSKSIDSGFMIFAILSMVAFLSCTKKDSEAKKESAAAVTKAVAVMNPTQGNEARGTVTFTVEAGGMRVVAQFEGVPEGEHGFHIHEFGDCSSGDGKSAGGHFNPEGMPHAGPKDAMRHIGDLGNITADAAGIVQKEFVDSHLTFEGANSIIGKGVILHAKPDDFTSQPTGAAGARISCGVIEAAKE